VKQQDIQQHICLQTEPFLSISSCFSVQTFLLTPELDESKKLKKQKKKKKKKKIMAMCFFFGFVVAKFLQFCFFQYRQISLLGSSI
jgi:hypothetical protein